jgi:hypothetical protein
VQKGFFISQEMQRLHVEDPLHQYANRFWKSAASMVKITDSMKHQANPQNVDSNELNRLANHPERFWAAPDWTRRGKSQG